MFNGDGPHDGDETCISPCGHVLIPIVITDDEWLMP